ncbi:E3 ubiquitin-protein ligase [Podosphaera aphanis]|nr:E3 ubiquitin-protein ligase [Podosphaera aphanis]
MVRIIKVMQPKHAESMSSWIKDFRDRACVIPLSQLSSLLESFPTRWPFPRGDLYHWITLLNRFDSILDQFCKAYKLDEGPQVVDFGTIILDADRGELDSEHLQVSDRLLIEAILQFSRILLQNCGNRSIYASSAHLNSLLNSTSLSLLECTLKLGSELAQRYQAATKRLSIPTRHINTPLLQSHYNISLEKVIQLSLPFSKTISSPIESTQSNFPTTPSSKGKEKTSFNTSASSQKSNSTTIYANDLVSLIKGGNGIGNCPTSLRNSVRKGSSSEVSWNEWGDVKLTFYPKSQPDGDRSASSNTPAGPVPLTMPTTPTSMRRSSNLGPRGQRSTKQNGTDLSPGSVPSPASLPSDDTPRQSFKVIEISSSKLRSNDIHSLLQENISGLPQELQYELLTKLRVALALSSSLETRRQALAIRLLAIINLAYIYQEAPFQEFVMKQDNEEPRRLQLVYQLAELVHPPADGDMAVPRNIQALAFATLDALQGYQNKLSDVCAALNTNVNHGVLLYVLRKAVAEMEENDKGDKITTDDEWRASLLSLLSSLSITSRTAVDLVTAGLIQILVEILNKRTNIAERYQPMVLTFLDTIMYSARDSFQTLVNCEGLDAISSLIVHEVLTAVENARSGNGMSAEYRSSIVDYEIPFFQQQTLKWLFKFIHHLMSAAGGFGGNFDRLLRNLIDSSQLLSSLRLIISNSKCFGSVVWTNAVNILNDFINNEPTSFAVIAEAGLSRALLEAVTGRPIIMQDTVKSDESQMDITGLPVIEGSPSLPSDDESDEDTNHIERLSLSTLQAPRQGPLAGGILPTSETINIVPQAFNAICLNTSGMKMFQTSKALETFFEIFESPEHVKCMETQKELPATLGSSFDELARHHPSLKTPIITAILNMVARVQHLCLSESKNKMAGAKLWTTNSAGQPVVVTPETLQQFTDSKSPQQSTDVQMKDFDVESTDSQSDKIISKVTAQQINVNSYICATVNFLCAILGNSSIRTEFCSSGGIDYFLNLSQSPALEFDFWETPISLTIQQIVAMLAESKPHLTLPSLLKRALNATNELRAFTTHDQKSAFFAPFVNSEARASADTEFLSKGTGLVKALASIHSLISIIPTCFLPSPYNHRNSPSIFNQINIADYYIQLIKILGPMLGSSLREVVKLRNIVPDHWKDATRSRDTPGAVISSCIVSGPNNTQTIELRESLSTIPLSTAAVTEAPASVPSGEIPSDQNPKTLSVAERDTPEFKNYITLRFLLKKMPRIISPFFQTLGKTLLAKRTIDSFQKKCHFSIADALAETVLAQLTIDDDLHSADTYKYWHGMIAVLHELLTESPRQVERPSQIITLVVQAFKDKGGFDKLNQILDIFAHEICQHESKSSTQERTLRLELATSGILSILRLYGHLVNGKNFMEAAQTTALIARSDRDRRGSENFSASQFLVELRMAILPTTRRLWSSELIEKGSSQISEKLIGVIRSIATADSEGNAIRRSDKPMTYSKPSHKTFKANQDFFTTLLDQGYPESLASEALYRCNNNINFALEYCRELRDVVDPARRNPIPETDTEPPTSANETSDLPTIEPITPSNAPPIQSTEQDTVSGIIDAFNGIEALRASDDPENYDQNSIPLVPSTNQDAIATSCSSSTVLPTPKTTENQSHTQVTVDDLNEERHSISENLIDKCLDVINAHGEVTFEVADLIMTVISRSSDSSAQRKAVGETLVVALTSFSSEDDLGKCGKKIAAYAHLLALMLRDKLFFSETVGELKENLETLLSFIKHSPQHVPKEPSPWISQILLIIEMLLSEDEKPQKINWTPPKDENSIVDPPVVEARELVVQPEQRGQLLDVILEILPRIGKDEPLALSVLRVLVILTRTREMAQTMGEKKNIQRLFVMAKQLAGASSARIQSPLMLILRHIIEDTETVKQIMKAEIKASLEPTRTQRNVDEKTYLRGLADTALRNPDIFVQATTEMVKFNRWPYPSSDSPSRHHTLVLKETSKNAPQISPVDTVLPAVQATEDLSIEDLKPSMKIADSEIHDAMKLNSEQKLPVVENPDGVIHFLLCELMNYRDVDDKDSTVAPAASTENFTALGNDDVSMSGTSMPPPPTTTSKDNKNFKTNQKAEFKVEEHPIYIYRCFILQCLTELLNSYNRTKIEFINFKRSAPPQAMTPSKPRSSVVNYLLFDLIPVGTLDHIENNYLRKKVVTSCWADSVITALLSKTNERPVDKSRDPYDSEVEPDLLFVRRFVLENILKAYKEASSSSEPLDIKYSRMLALADLMSHIMQGKENVGVPDQTVAAISQKQLRRIMFDKGYISALTSSIADIDLNFPNAKRAVKYILRPLKTLTTTAINLSDLSLISTIPGQGEEDEIESATSLSEQEDEREETPDLFRNSTLGMFEHGVENSESEDNEDEDMDGAYHEYGDEMDYDDGDMDEDDEDNISEEEDDIEGIGPIEGLSGDHAMEVEVIMDDQNDDDDSSADDDDDPDSNDDDDDDDEDDDHRVEIIEELEDIQHQLEEDGEDLADEWDSDGEDDEGVVHEDFEDQYEDHDEHPTIDIGAMGHLVRALGDDPAAIEMLGRLAEVDEQNGDHVVADYADDDDEDDENEDADEDEEDMFEAQYPVNASGENVTFGWPHVYDSAAPSGHRPRGGFSSFPSFPGGPRDTLDVPNISYRAHRPTVPMSRIADDGINPLLQRNRSDTRMQSMIGSWIPATRRPPGNDLLDIGFSSQGGPLGDGPATAQFLEDVIRTLPLPSPFGINGQALQFHITTTGPVTRHLPTDLEAFFGGRHTRFEERRLAPEPGSATHFNPQSTAARWSEESKILFGNTWIERAGDLASTILSLLVPPAIEADKAIKTAQLEKARLEQQEADRKAEEERIAIEAKADEEKLAREKEEREQEAAERAAERATEIITSETLPTRNTDVSADHVEPRASSDNMEGVETEATETPNVITEVSTDTRPRATAIIRGTTFDITDLGIDAEFLAELPEEIREEVIMSAVAERRSQAAAIGAQPSEIDQEFLNALPEDIREEIIQQERQDRRRREREERNRQATAATGGAAIGDMDAATILATLDPAFRNQVLMEQDDATLALLPPEMANRARAALRDHPSHVRPSHAAIMRRAIGGFQPHVNESRNSDAQRPSRRYIVQMLDKPGVATLLRLMFIFQHGSLRNTLNAVLQNVCMNRLNRHEVLSTILHILQDGSIDMTAVERSFAHLSLRAKQPKDSLPKTPVPIKRTLTGLGLLTQTNFEASPLMVVSQCLTALIYLNQVNQHVSAFFLTEHDAVGGLKRSLSRKGKAKENRASKFAINSLLGLLDRHLIMESSSVMESLSTLLNMITSPLQVLQRRQKIAEEEGTTEITHPVQGTVASSNVPEVTSTNNGQPSGQSSETTPLDTEISAQMTEAQTDLLSPIEGDSIVQPANTVGTSEAKNQSQKKQRPIIPPIIPEHNLKLVINIFVARECSSKTFRETLSTIKNLSAIPDAKTVFGRELISKAQALGEIILVDLENLYPQIQRATTGTEIQGVALAKFSPGGSDQNKLLRVLTALDHLFDPKREKKEKAADENASESSQLVVKQDLLSSLYVNPTFGRMWQKLSACLNSIRQREHMLNVATILLPLIEALMVVCKNTTIKDSLTAKSQISKDPASASLPLSSQMENLFFTFTEEHRKILNDLVRNTPKLMSGTFSLLVKNPKVLEFDNKRNYFNRSIHTKTSSGRESFPPLQLSVRRDLVFHDSFKSLYFQSGDQMKYGKLSIRFHGEEGVDAGGVTREWFQVLSRQMFDPGYALFIPVSSDRTTFHPNQLSSVNEEHLMFFKFIGRIIGKALYEGRVLDCHFSRAVYKRILGKSVSVKDMESLDPDYYKSLIWMLENDITDIITETFSIDSDKFGVNETIDFIPNGRHIAVTEENKHEYVRLMVEWKLTGSVKEQLDEFLKGFHDIIPADLVSIFNEQELELLISGLPEIDVDDWKGNTEYHNYSTSSTQIQWFWRAVRSFDKEERAKLLQFVTGTSKVPLNGFKELEGMNGFSRFNIHRDYGNKNRLPSSHTCFNQLDIPEYESYEILRQQLLTAITAGSEYFGFA